MKISRQNGSLRPMQYFFLIKFMYNEFYCTTRRRKNNENKQASKNPKSSPHLVCLLKVPLELLDGAFQRDLEHVIFLRGPIADLFAHPLELLAGVVLGVWGVGVDRLYKLDKEGRLYLFLFAILFSIHNYIYCSVNTFLGYRAKRNA